MGRDLGLEPKEGNALVNGSPCAAALLADGRSRRPAGWRSPTKRSRSRWRRSRRRSRPTTPSSPGSGATTARATALERLGALLAGARGERAGHQAPVSFRILPRVLGQAERALAEAERGADSSLSSVTDNPVFLPPSPEHPGGRVFSTGGYHNSVAPQRLHALTVVYADLCRLAERHVEALWVGPGKRQSQDCRGAPQSRADGDHGVGGGGRGGRPAAAHAAQRARPERCRCAGLPSFRRNAAAGAALEACLALLLATAAQICLAEDIRPAPPLHGRLARVTAICPAARRPYDASIAELAASLRDEVYGAA